MTSPIRKIPLKIALLTLLLSITSVSCIVESDPAGATADAWSEIYAAIDFKEKECGHKPDYFLIIPDPPSEYGVRLCSLMIIREECPFYDYPVFCLEMTGFDIPGIGP